MAKPVSATSQKNTSSMAKELTAPELLMKMIADQTSKWPIRSATISQKYPSKGKFNTINPNTEATTKIKKIETCVFPAWNAIIDSETATDTVT